MPDAGSYLTLTAIEVVLQSTIYVMIMQIISMVYFLRFLMHKHPLVLLFALAASACTFTSQDDVIRGEFNPPFVYQAWHTEHTILKDGGEACVISSGGAGISVILVQKNGSIDIKAKSNRMMEPGYMLTVNAGGKTFHTYNEYFHSQSAHE